MPEALVAALDELTAAWQEAMADPAFLADFDTILREYAGVPSLLYDATRLTEKVGGARILLKREDLNHTGAHKIRNVLGQALLTQRMGKHRVIAETGAGQHGVASATAAAYFGLDCTVYMGSVDTKRQALNVARMELLGAKVVPVDSGSATLKDAINEALRDWVATRRPHGLPLRHRRRPAPVPEHGPRLHPRHRRRGARPVPRADRPAARRDRGLRGRRLQRDRAVHRVPRRPRRPHLRLRARRRRRRDRPARRHHPRRRLAASCTAPAPSCSRTRTARPSSRTRSRPASTTPASGPQHAHLAKTGRADYLPVTDAQAMDALALLARTEGIIAAIESAHALAGAFDVARELGPEGLVLVNLSGRGDKDMETAREWFGLGHEHVERGGERVTTTSTAFEKARADGRAALVGYLPAGLPRRPGRHRRAAGDGRRRLRRDRGRAALQRPGDGRPDDPGRRPAGARPRRPHHRRAPHRRGGRRHRHADGRHDLLEPRRALRRRPVRPRPRGRRGSGADHPRPHPGRRPAVAGRRRRARPRQGLSWSRRPRPTRGSR